VHQASAKQVAQRIGVIGQDDFGHLRLRFVHRARR
jgi:hypothetical protein